LSGVWHYVTTALDTLQPGKAAPLLALLQAPQPPPITAILTLLFTALGDLRVDAALVLDDYHVIEAPVVHQAVTFRSTCCPLRQHLLIATRTDPPLPLARLCACQ
jgi:LuxR family transcriptional regulator, maltose regulon positive regulatory protein